MADAGTAPGSQHGTKSPPKGPLALLTLLGVLLVFSFVTTSAVLQMLFSSDRASAAAQRQELDSLLSGTAAKSLEQRMATGSTQQLGSTNRAVPEGQTAREAPPKGSETELARQGQPRKSSEEPERIQEEQEEEHAEEGEEPWEEHVGDPEVEDEEQEHGHKKPAAKARAAKKGAALGLEGRGGSTCSKSLVSISPSTPPCPSRPSCP